MALIPYATQRRLMWKGVAASVIGAVLVATYVELLPSAGGESGRADSLVVTAVALLGYLAMSIPFGHWWCKRATRRAEAAADAGDPEAGRLVLALPAVVARMTLAMWVGAAIIFAALQYAYEPSYYRSLRVFDAIALAGCTTAALEFLGSEWLMRPTFAQVLGGRVPPERCGVVGLRRRLQLSWLLGSGIPLLAVIVTPFSTTPSQRADLVPAYVVLGVAGLLAGWTLADRSARSITEPLRALTDALRRVEAGDLDVSVPVDDGGDIGVVQSGFNAAVDGLRERRRIEQLFGMQVGEQVARLAIERGAYRGIERAECSILFVDVVSSSMLVNTLPPEDVARVFTRLYDVVVRTVHAEGGWVNKFQGDGAMCVFGPPASYADHAQRALRAARTLRQEVLALAAVLRDFDAAIGVSAGTVVAGNIGGADRYEYTVIGRPVHEAARLTEAAKQRLGRVLAGDDVVERSGDEASSWHVAAELTLRGFTEPVRTYEPAPRSRTEAPVQ